MAKFFEDLGKMLGEKAETVSVIASEAMEVQKLKHQVRGLERSNGHDLEDLGRAVYQRYLDGALLDETAQELCSAIQEREEGIEDCLKRIALIKGEQKCPVCGRDVNKGMSFCPYCGTRMPEFPEAEEMEVEIVVEDESASAEAEETADTEASATEETTDTETSAEEEVKEAVEEVTETTESIADAVSKNLTDLEREAAELAKEVAERAQKNVDEVAEEVSGRISHFEI